MKQQDDMAVARWKRLGDMLMEAGLITAGQLSEGLAEKERQKCFLGQALVRLGYVSQDELISFLVKQCKIPHINLVDYSIDPRIVRLLPNELCLQYKLIAIDNLGSILTVAMVNPLDLDALEQARSACPDLKLKPILCTPEHFETVAARLLISESQSETSTTQTLSLDGMNFGAARSGAATTVRAATPPETPRTPIASGLPAGRDDFSLLVREVLEELMSIFQGPVQGGSAGPFPGIFAEHLEFSFTLGVSGEMCYVTPGVATILGHEPARFQSAFLDLLTDHPGNTVLRRAIILAKSGQQTSPVEAEFRNADGAPRMLLVALIPVFDVNHKLAAIQGVARDITRRERTEQHVFHAATHDALTGLHNRRSFMARLEEATVLASRHKAPVSVGVFNLDRFTELNQELGPVNGDLILVHTGRLLRESLRGEDIIARTGGDEFCVLMPQVLPWAARHGLTRCHLALAAAPFITPDGREIPLTATSGLVPIHGDEKESAPIVDRARELVLEGKRSGGDQVVTDDL